MSTRLSRGAEKVALFGTTGGSDWRKPFRATYEHRGIPCFDPRAQGWDPSPQTLRRLAGLMALKLARVPVLVVAIPGDYAGFESCVDAVAIPGHLLHPQGIPGRRAALFVSRRLSLPDVSVREASRRARLAALAQVQLFALPNIVLVDSLEELLSVSLELVDRAG